MKQTRPGDIDSFIQLANLLTLDAPILAVTGTVSADTWITGIVIASNSGGKGAVVSDSSPGFIPTVLEPTLLKDFDFDALPM